MAAKTGKAQTDRFFRKLWEFIIAIISYGLFTVYLYQPYLKDLDLKPLCVLLNAFLAALGCYLLSRRWVASFPAALFAGGIYGFSPFALGLGMYQATGGMVFAAVPWMFCPAAFWQQILSNHTGPKRHEYPLITAGLALLPFVIIILIFSILGSPHFRLFPIPIQAKLRLTDMLGLLSIYKNPGGGSVPFGFYHLPIAALVMGLAIFFAAHRPGPIIIFTLGLVLTFSNSILNVSPLIWTAVPLVCCSILIGLGIQALAWSTSADKGWLLICACVTGLCAVVTMTLGLRGQSIFFQDAVMFALAAILVLIIFFMARGGQRIHWFRWLLLSAAFLLDISIGARHIIETIFVS